MRHCSMLICLISNLSRRSSQVNEVIPTTSSPQQQLKQNTMATLSLTASLARAGRSPAIGMGAAQAACCTRAAVASTSPTLTAVGGLGSAGRQCTEKNLHSSLWAAYGTGVDVQGEAGGDDNVANPVEIEFAFDFISPYAYLYDLPACSQLVQSESPTQKEDSGLNPRRSAVAQQVDWFFFFFFFFFFFCPMFSAWMRTQTWPSDRVTVVPRPVLFASLLNQHGYCFGFVCARVQVSSQDPVRSSYRTSRQ